MKFLYSLTLLLLTCFTTEAQVLNQIGGSIGYSNYLGDLVVPSFTFNQSSFAANLFCKKQLDANISLRGNILIGKLKGDDLFYHRNASRGINFQSNFFELTLIGEYDLLGQRRYPKGGGGKDILSPYVFAGLGFMIVDQSIHYGSADNPDISAVFSYMHPAIPLGMGFKKDIGKSLQVSIELGMRLTFSDYIDGVKKSGDPTDNDVYFFGGLGVIYQLTDYAR